MAKRISRAFIDTLLDRADIVGTINRRVPLKKAGKDFQACCPFHNEKTPSFTVAPQKGFYYCFGCGAKGNAIRFLMDYEHLSFVDAVEKLAEESNITVEYEQYDEVKAQRRKDLYDVLADVTELYEKNLFSTQGDEAKAYLSERQLDVETSAFFRLGYSQAGNHLQRLFSGKHSQEELRQVGLLGQGDGEPAHFYDQFRNRLMFPIRDPRGRVLGFGARALGDAKPKYLNTSDTELFNKSYVLYGLYEELQTNRDIEYLIVVEGYMDVIALHQMGVKGAVAALGTAFTAGHINLLHRYTKKIFICFDGDNAGKKAARRAMDTILPAMSMDMEIRMVFLPDGEDPDTLVRKIGKAAFVQLMSEGQLFSEFVYKTLIADSDLQFVEGRGEVAARAKTLFDDLPDSEYKSILYQGLVERIGMDVYQLAQGLAIQTKSPPLNQPPLFHSKVSQQRLQGGIESRLIRLLLASPELADCVHHHVLLRVGGESDAMLLYYLLELFQTHMGSNEEKRQIAMSTFEGEALARLQQIENSEKLIDAIAVKESMEEKRLRWQADFIGGMTNLLNDIQRKIYFR